MPGKAQIVQVGFSTKMSGLATFRRHVERWPDSDSSARVILPVVFLYNRPDSVCASWSSQGRPGPAREIECPIRACRSTVRRRLRSKLQNRAHVVRWILAVITLRKLRQVCRRHLQFTGGRAIPLALGSVAGRAITRKHRLARTRVTLLQAAGGQKHAGDQQAPKDWEFRERELALKKDMIHLSMEIHHNESGCGDTRHTAR